MELSPDGEDEAEVDRIGQQGLGPGVEVSLLPCPRLTGPAWGGGVFPFAFAAHLDFDDQYLVGIV